MNAKMTKRLKERYCEALAKGARRGKAADSIGVNRHTVTNAARKDPEFALAIEDAEAAFCDQIEDLMLEKMKDKSGNVLLLAWLFNRCGKDVNGEPRWQDKRFWREPDKVKEQTIEELKAELEKRGFDAD